MKQTEKDPDSHFSPQLICSLRTDCRSNKMRREYITATSAYLIVNVLVSHLRKIKKKRANGNPNKVSATDHSDPCFIGELFNTSLLNTFKPRADPRIMILATMRGLAECSTIYSYNITAASIWLS
jgi:hypothetical protein